MEEDEAINDDTFITWCHKTKHSNQWQPAIMGPLEDKYPSVEILYQVAAILIAIPQWSERYDKTLDEKCLVVEDYPQYSNPPKKLKYE